MKEFNPDIYSFESKPCPAGSRKAIDFQLTLDEEGNEFLAGDEYDQQEIIQSYADECSIERIIISHGLGDEMLLDSKPGVFLNEDDVNIIKLSQQNNVELNASLTKLYENYTWMSYDSFVNAVLHGDYNALKKPEVKEEPNA